MKVRLQLESTYMSIIAFYAPTEVDVAIEAENFYEKLQDLVAETNQKDVIITLEDFNARVGPSTTPSRLHDPHNPDKKNQNGTRLVDLCNQNGLVITNTICPTRRFINGHGLIRGKRRRAYVGLCPNQPKISFTNY